MSETTTPITIRLYEQAQKVRGASLMWADDRSAPVPDEWWSAAQVYEDAAAEIARLTRELEEAREALLSTRTAFADQVRHAGRMREALKDSRVLFDHIRISGGTITDEIFRRIDRALATPQEASASNPVAKQDRPDEWEDDDA